MNAKILQAIRYAVDSWHVDIISMSFAFEEIHPALEDAIRYAVYRETIIFAAASGSPGSKKIAYPARAESVICINSADLYGNPSKFNPRPAHNRDNFSILGESVKGTWLHGEAKSLSGTSVATTMAAGVAALILQFARQNIATDSFARIRRPAAMRAVLRFMSPLRGGFRYISPGRLWDRPPEAAARILENVLERSEMGFDSDVD